MLEAELGGESAAPEEIAAAARLAAGDLERARLLLGARGRELREDVERCTAAALAARSPRPPGGACSTAPKRPARMSKRRSARCWRRKPSPGLKRTARDIADESKRAGRRRRTEILDLGLELCAVWLRDLAAIAAGAEDVVFNRDRLDQLRSQANGLARRLRPPGAEAVQETRRSLDLNVSEELALEALFFRLEREFC